MCYFAKFSEVLRERHQGNFADSLDSPYRFDSYKGKTLRIREIDRRPKVEPVMVKPVETPPPTQEEPNDELQFAVINLDEELERRRKSTADNNPVQPESAPQTFPVTHLRSKSTRGLVSQKEKSPGFTIEAKATGGNRQQRRAAKAIATKAAKKAYGSKRTTIRGNGPSLQETPHVVSLSGLDMGFRLE